MQREREREKWRERKRKRKETRNGHQDLMDFILHFPKQLGVRWGKTRKSSSVLRYSDVHREQSIPAKYLAKFGPGPHLPHFADVEIFPTTF